MQGSAAQYVLAQVEVPPGHASWSPANPAADEQRQRLLSMAPQGVHGWDVLRALDHIRALALPGSLDARAAGAIEARVRKVGCAACRRRTTAWCCRWSGDNPTGCCCVVRADPLPAVVTGGPQLLQDTPEGQRHRGAAARRPAAHHLCLGVPGRDAHPRPLVRDPGEPQRQLQHDEEPAQRVHAPASATEV